MNWSVTILTLFPEMFPGPLGQSLAGKAGEQGLWELKTLDIRDFSIDKHNTVDDKSFGGGTGLVMRADVLERAVEAAKAGYKRPKMIYFSPRGKVFDQVKAEELVQSPENIMLCGRYEGVDERVLEHYGFEEISLGDFILSGGEIAALAAIDACLRLIPGVIKTAQVHAEESFSSAGNNAGLLEYPHYTRPAIWRGLPVPEVLLSGHHANVREWRLKQAERITRERRPDLWAKYMKD